MPIDDPDLWSRLRAALARLAPIDFDPVEIATMDRALAAQVAARPGAVEARLLDGLPELAAAPGAVDDGLPTELALLFGIAAPRAPRATARPQERRLDATLRALDPVAMLAVLARARGEHLIALGPGAASASVHLAAFFAARAGAGGCARAPIAPELRDHIAALRTPRAEAEPV